jgi:hypothetical protein
MPDTVNLRQGVIDSWDSSTGACTLRIAGGQILNASTLKAGAATLAEGDVVTVLSTRNDHYILGPSTNPGDPGTVPSWNVDISALTGQVDTIQTVTIPAVQNDVTIVQGDVVELNTVTVPAVQAVADGAQSTADSAATDAATAQTTADTAQSTATTAATNASTALAKFPITTTDIGTGAITTPKIAANAITATEIATGAITATKLSATAIDGKTITGALLRTAATGQRVEIDSASWANYVRFFSGNASETGPGYIRSSDVGGVLSVDVRGPDTAGATQPWLWLSTNISDDSTIIGAQADVVQTTAKTLTRIQTTAGDIDLVTAGGTPKANGVPIVATTATQTLTNKDLSDPSNTFPAHPQPVFVSDAPSLAAALATTYAPGGTVLGTAFTAPATGKVYITVGGRIRLETNNNTMYLSFEVRAGATVGSGTVVLAADNGRAVAVGGNGTGVTYLFAGSSRRWLLTGLTPGSSYNVRTMHACQTAGTVNGTLFNRDLLIEPVL